MDVGKVSGITASIAAANSGSTKETSQNKGTDEVKKYPVSGKTVGQPKLSEKGKKYYDELKNKYGDMDFVLVSRDMKEAAKANAGSFANPNKMVVLIDEDKIEQMANDENFRKQYEGIIEATQKNLPKLKEAFGNSSNVKGYGMQVGDNGETSFFAIMKKSSDQMAAGQKKRLEKKKAEKKDAEKKAEKAAEKKKNEERIKEKRSEKAEETDKAHGRSEEPDDEDYEIITASSIEELVQKVGDYEFARRSDSVLTPQEQMIGSHVDFKG